MYQSFAVGLLAVVTAQALSHTALAHSHLHSHKKRAAAEVCPVSVQSSKYLCNVKSTNTNSVRDLGYVGQIGRHVVHTYGDTLNGPGSSFYMTSDSSAIGLGGACSILDSALVDGDHPAQFVPVEEKWGEVNTADAMGITNVQPTGPESGMLFFLKNHRPGGANQVIGAGVADVTMDGNIPKATRLAEYWWNTQAGEPNYGDITSYSGSRYIWGFGHGGNGQYTYVTRVRKDSYKNLQAYKYFDGSTGSWSHNRLHNPSPAQALQWNEEEGPAWGVGQGQMIWSHYYKKIMFVYAQNWANPDGRYSIYARTADRPRGPWSKAQELFAATPAEMGGFIYSPIPNPYFDPSGKTLVVTVTNSPNTIEAYKVTFN